MKYKTFLMTALLAAVSISPSFARGSAVNARQPQHASVEAFAGCSIADGTSSKFVSSSAGMFWTGDVFGPIFINLGSPPGVGFQFQSNDIQTASFATTTLGNGQPFVAYVWTTNGKDTSVDYIPTPIPVNGIYFWNFNKSNQQLPSGARVVQLIFEDYGPSACANNGAADFEDSAYNALVNGQSVVLITGPHPVQFRIVGEFNAVPSLTNPHNKLPAGSPNLVECVVPPCAQ